MIFFMTLSNGFSVVDCLIINLLMVYGQIEIIRLLIGGYWDNLGLWES